MMILPAVLAGLLAGNAGAASAQPPAGGSTAPAASRTASEVNADPSSFRVRPFGGLGPESSLAREVYGRLLRYVRRTDPQMRDWPHAAGCRFHRYDAHDELAVRQNADVALGYAVLSAGRHGRTEAPVSWERIDQDLRGLLRYLATTHKANLLPTGDGQPWGDQWQSAYWTAIAGTAAWLAWERLDEETRALVARMIEHEADRFNDRPPDSGMRGDTKAEENAWNSQAIALAACMFPDHPRAGLWRERAIVYMINSFVREQDRTSDRVIDGRPARERISAVTLYPDYTLENHRRVHPDYMTTGSLLLRNTLTYRAAGEPIPQACSFNVPEMFALVKRLAAANGSLFYVNGQDWWPHRHDVLLTLPAFMSVLFEDAEAAYLERAALESYARMHGRFPDGSAYDPREFNYRGAEEEMIAAYAGLYLLHRMFGDGPSPVSREEFVRRQSGIRVFEAGGFAIHRTPARFFSFAWTNGAMGLIYPADDTWFTSPSETSMIGRIVCEGRKDSRPVVRQHRVRAGEDTLCVGARIERCEGTVEQQVGAFSLPDGPVVYVERLIARTRADVREVSTGSFFVLNEDAPGLCPNRRVVHRRGGAETIPGAGGEQDRLLVWDSDYANIDGRMGIVCGGRDRRMAYRDARAYARSRLEEELIPNHRTKPGAFEAGATIGLCAVAYLADEPPERTARRTIEPAEQGPILSARFDGWYVVVNSGSEVAEWRGPAGRRESLPPLGTLCLHQEDGAAAGP